MSHDRIRNGMNGSSNDADGAICNGAHVELTKMNGSQRYQSSENITIDEEESKRPSNETLLSTAFYSFMTFTLCQSVAAVVAGSEAMMGDSAAMFVDALTYLFNLIAERKKQHFHETYAPSSIIQDPEQAKRIRQRAKRKMIVTMELIPPLISVTTLIVVTAFVLRHAIRVLILDIHRPVSLQGDPNLNLMLAFSSVNLVLDFLNVCCFARAKHLLGFETHSSTAGATGEEYETLVTNDDMLDEATPMNGNNGRDEMAIRNLDNGEISPSGSLDPPGRVVGYEMPHQNDDSFDSCDEHDEKEAANLNMCSAYTHVFADTLRSIAVIAASVTAELVDDVTPEEADATAAVVVSGLILLSLLPLFNGLCRTFGELRAIRAEEESERLFAEHANKKAVVEMV